MAGLQKPEVATRCLRSLLRSSDRVLSGAIKVRVHVVDDASPQGVVDEWMREAKRHRVAVEWTRMDGRSGASSFSTAVEIAATSRADLVYFVEDDYLHYPEALECMMSSYAQLRALSPDHIVAMTSYDCPDRYSRPRYPSTIEFAGGRYWRTVRHTTGTFMVAATTLARNPAVYQEFGEYGRRPDVCEDTTLNTVYKQVPCFSPIPSLAIHLQYEDTLPLVLPTGGWLALWEQNAS